MGTAIEIFTKIESWFQDVLGWLGISGLGGTALLYTAIARWVFILLAFFIVSKAIASLLAGRSTPEVFAYLNMRDGGFHQINRPITHWENTIGRSKRSDIVVNDPSVSRIQGTLTRDDHGRWKYMDAGSSNGTRIGSKTLKQGQFEYVEPGDPIYMGETVCTIFPISLEEQRNNKAMRKRETFLLSPWTSLLALTLFQAMTVLQLKIALGDEFSSQIPMAFGGMIALMWIYTIGLRTFHQRGFEVEILAFFISTLSLAVTASKFPDAVLKQFITVVMGVVLFISMCWFLRNLDRSKAVRKYLYILAGIGLVLTMLLASTINGANNWVRIGGLTLQPSELVKLAYIWGSAATLDELMEKKNTLIFMGFSVFCFGCLALMNDFGTALIFFVTFLVISFMREGDFTKLILIVGVAFVGGLMVLRFKSHVAARFAVWGHVWEFADGSGYQQTRTMSAAASGGLVGVGAGNGWLKYIFASETDLVFGFVSEEWGLIIAAMTVLSIITLSIFAFRTIMNGRSTFYTIAACSAMALFLFQTILNVFGSIDLFPLTGVTFPFLSTGGTSMLASWGMLSFVKAADNRQDASMAVKEQKPQDSYSSRRGWRRNTLSDVYGDFDDVDGQTEGRIDRDSERGFDEEFKRDFEFGFDDLEEFNDSGEGQDYA